MKKSRAFTLIEILITLFIIITLAAIMLPKFYNYDKETKLDIAAAEVKEAILETQSLALAPPTSSVDIEYYKIVFNNNSYQIFEHHKSTGLDSEYGAVKNLPNDVVFEGTSLPAELKFYVENRGRADQGLILDIRQKNGSARRLNVIGETGQVIIENRT